MSGGVAWLPDKHAVDVDIVEVRPTLRSQPISGWAGGQRAYDIKILKGPSLLICRWSSRRSSELMINLMTAKALGLTIPQSEHPEKERPMHFILFVPIGLIAGALAGRVVGG